MGWYFVQRALCKGEVIVLGGTVVEVNNRQHAWTDKEMGKLIFRNRKHKEKKHPQQTF